MFCSSPSERNYNSRLVSLSYSVSGGTGLGFSVGSSTLASSFCSKLHNRQSAMLQSVASSRTEGARGLGLSFQLLLKGVASRFAKAQIAPG